MSNLPAALQAEMEPGLRVTVTGSAILAGSGRSRVTVSDPVFDPVLIFEFWHARLWFRFWFSSCLRISQIIPLFSVKELEANLRLHCYVTSDWHNIAVWFAQPRCFVFILSFVIVRVFVRFARCKFYFYILFVSQIVIIIVFVLIERTKWSTTILVFVFVFVTQIALVPRPQIHAI